MRKKIHYKKNQVQLKKTTHQTLKPGQLRLPWQTCKPR